MPPKSTVPRMTDVMRPSKPRAKSSRSSASNSKSREPDESDEQNDAFERGNASSSNVSRKRTRSAAVHPTMAASPNPKARKSLKTKAEPLAEDTTIRKDSDEESGKRQSTLATRQKRMARPTKFAGSDGPSPHTKPVKPAPLSKQIKQTGQTAGRGRLPNLPPLDLSEPDSDGEDPLLLVDDNQWVSAPWRPIYHADASDAVKKEEDEVSAGFFLAEPSSSNSPAHPSPNTTLDPYRLAQAIGRPAFDLPSDEEEDEPFPSGRRDPDSSFVGMEIDSEQEVSDFIAPVRMNSPPSRKRRTSAVSQRVSTPGLSDHPEKLENSPSRPDPRSPIARPRGHRAVLGSPGPLSFAAFTPRQPRQQSIVSEHVPSYPSPAFKGKALGSLSPDKGRGPSRGSLPRLRESIELDSPPVSLTSTAVAQTEDIKQDNGTNKRSTSRPLLVSSSPESDAPLNLQPYPDLSQRLKASAFNKSVQSTDIERRGRGFTRGQPKSLAATELNFTSSNESITTTEQEEVCKDGLSVRLLQADRECNQQQPSVPGQDGMHHLAQDTSLNEAAEYDNGEIEEEDVMPLVEISSRDPMVAARAAAILKLHHDYLEDSKLLSLRFNVRQSTPMGADALNLADPEPALVIPPYLIREAEREVSTPPVARTRHYEDKSKRVSSPVPARENAHARTASGRVILPGTPSYPSRPMVVVDPASSRTSDENDYNTWPTRTWTKAEWKHLEACLLAERDRLAMEHSLAPDDVDVGDVDIDWVVQYFLDQERLVGDEDGWEGDGEWSRNKIRRRCMALQLRHSKRPRGTITIPGSPMVMPLTPLASRESTPLADLASADHSRERHPFPSTSTSLLLPASLTAPRYGHLYDEAALTARLPRPPQNSHTPKSPQHDSPTPLPGSRRSLSLTRLREPHVDSLRSESLRQQGSQPPVSKPAGAIDTPTATSRVLNLLGLGDSAPASPIEILTSSRTRPSERPHQARSYSPESHSLVESLSRDDLNHVEVEGGGPVERPVHPKDLVVLHPIPPREDPELGHRGRRISGGSVKDLVQNFEAMQAEKDKERARVSTIVVNGRRSSHSLTRKRSNLSTSQPITAEWDNSVLYDSSHSDIIPPSTPVSVSAPHSSRFGFSLTGSLRKVPWFRS